MESDLNWCLGGCDKKSQDGSIYCSPDCFRQAITCNPITVQLGSRMSECGVQSTLPLIHRRRRVGSSRGISFSI
ncbi:hypothetical protein BC833DRAFT_611095 [Globomyces pollinis-pini]|nr:hypothetical protein BC833DRAFT_611095 [Globomyces pollinis-pini]